MKNTTKPYMPKSYTPRKKTEGFNGGSTPSGFGAGKKSSHSAKNNASVTPSVSQNPLLNEAKKMLARKRFGQNFLISQSVIDGIVRCLDLDPATDNVLEIGPGLGFLTQSIRPQVKHLTCVELDKRMVDYLARKFQLLAPKTSEGIEELEAEDLDTIETDEPEEEAPYVKGGNLLDPIHVEGFSLIQQDILAYPLDSIPYEKFKVVGNIPYNITSGVLFKFAGELEETIVPMRQKVQQLTFMVQREVGERMVAPAGGKAYSPLSIALQYWFEVQQEFLVPPEAFQPRPKVTSVVISLIPRAEPLCQVDDLAFMKKLVRASFQQRRKTLKNSLLHDTGIQAAALEKALLETGISGMARPETLTIEQFGALSNALSRQQ
ncbi:MAG: 16S rRNA (adenine(1518)-N(6)/adenine(1519)-N(6))-dimethyltransferase [Vampirovibrio sp.]|nr:16S rRNA (adenine(1518)-N(6)/adenine(1519)-N(6))-dimethyltransferase [Vampirovibrio sp.]